MKSDKSLGNLGESFARGYLAEKGFTILWSPYRCRIGEIDIVAMDGPSLVFIEVKTRRSKRFGTPLEAVTPRKQRQIIRVAQFFMKFVKQKPAFKTCRFDVLGIFQGAGHQPPVITHVKDAFRMNF